MITGKILLTFVKHKLYNLKPSKNPQLFLPITQARLQSYTWLEIFYHEGVLTKRPTTECFLSYKAHFIKLKLWNLVTSSFFYILRRQQMYIYHQNGRYPLGPVAISSTVSEISNPVATFKIILSEYVKCIYITWRTCLIQMKSQTILLCMIRIKYYHLYILEVFFNLTLLLTKRGFNMF